MGSLVREWLLVRDEPQKLQCLMTLKEKKPQGRKAHSSWCCFCSKGQNVAHEEFVSGQRGKYSEGYVTIEEDYQELAAPSGVDTLKVKLWRNSWKGVGQKTAGANVARH